MWIIFGCGTLLFGILSLLQLFSNKQSAIFRFLSLSFTALTLCAFYAEDTARLIAHDYTGLLDTMPTTSTTLWLGTLFSLLLNAISLARRLKKQ